MLPLIIELMRCKCFLDVHLSLMRRDGRCSHDRRSDVVAGDLMSMQSTDTSRRQRESDSHESVHALWDPHFLLDSPLSPSSSSTRDTCFPHPVCFNLCNSALLSARSEGRKKFSEKAAAGESERGSSRDRGRQACNGLVSFTRTCTRTRTSS